MCAARRPDIRPDITPFTPDKLDVASELFVSVFNAPPWNDRWTTDAARRRLGDALRTPGFLGFVAEGPDMLGLLTGWLERWYTGEQFYLHEFCVRRDLQRTGIGTRLIIDLEAALRARSVLKVFLRTASGDAAQAFYTAKGFAIDDSINMTREL